MVDYKLAMNRAAMSMMQLRVDSHLKQLSPEEKKQFLDKIMETPEEAVEEKVHEGFVIE